LRQIGFSDASMDGAALEECSAWAARFVGTKAKKLLAPNTDLEFALFLDADLEQASLTGSKLAKTQFMKANLAGANLSKVDLAYADLSHANLKNTDLSGANLTRAKMHRAKDFDSARTGGAKLSKAIWTDEAMAEAEDFSHATV
jgi:uncharacterized protein YjbI with pentapeptide repeats